MKRLWKEYWSFERFHSDAERGECYFEIVLNTLSVHAVFPWKTFLFGWTIDHDEEGWDQLIIHIGPFGVRWEREP